MHERDARFEEEVPHELVGGARLGLGDGFDHLYAKGGFHALRLAQQKVNVLAKNLVEIMDVLVGTDNHEDIVQGHLGADHVMAVAHPRQRAEEGQFGG